MTVRAFTLEDLKRILVEVAGADEDMGPDAEILDLGFEQLGYESLALLETGGRIERDYAITLADDALHAEVTPRELIDAVNNLLSAPAV
ncbi:MULTISPECIES: acyl carrier protein [Streptomyces]|uniref:acyl carrier protein n=1 Tax=Streptomyces TaxID=1883 RepID=UPI0004CBF3D0|nr:MULTISPECIES: acyl carrier protein [Streptomyces]